MKTELQELLKQLADALNAKNLTTEHSIDQFNIFEILGVGEKEVIICRFVGALLDPCGSHGLGTKPLALFMKDVLKEDIPKETLQSAIVKLEDAIDKNRRADIVIYADNKVYPIEVKIWAKDQDSQLQDYFTYYNRNYGISCIYYLTPTGWDPSENSKRALTRDQLCCLSFKKDILAWVTQLKKEKEDSPAGQCLEQFEKIIVRMCNNSMKQEVIEEVLGLNGSEFDVTDSLKAAIELINCKDVLFRKIQQKYLHSILKLADGDSLIDTGENETIAKHSIMKVMRSGEACAWICVETNLYVVARFASQPNGWEKYSDTEKTYWKYISPYNGSTKFPLKDLKNLPKGEIDLTEDLQHAVI